MSRLNTETFDFKFMRQNLAPGSGHPTWGGEASGPSGGTARASIRGSWGQIPGCRRSAQFLTASPRLQTSEGISKRWYICVVSKQTLRELPTPAGAHAPASPGVCSPPPRPQGAGLDVGTAGPMERGLGAEGRQVQATFRGEGRGEAAAESALCRGPLRGVQGLDCLVCSQSEQSWVCGARAAAGRKSVTVPRRE